MMAEKQRTIENEVTVTGIGLHCGKNVTMTFKPAPDNYGYKFKRIDLEGSPVINADIDNVVDISRGTTIEQNGVRISTIEHTLASLAGLDIDNVLIELDCAEAPIMDGSAKPFVEALLKAGIKEQSANRDYFVIEDNICITDKDRDSEMIALPCDDYRLSVMIEYENSVLGTQNAHYNKSVNFVEEIAPSKTFVFLHELEFLLNNNLIKGGDLSNAIVIVNEVISQEKLDKLAKLFNHPKVEVKKEGILNNVNLTFKNEPARHKLLDIIGDMALIGRPLKGHIIANKPGHVTNVEFAKKIKQLIKKQKLSKNAPKYDPNATPLYDINQIKKIIPHRHPFLLVDKILEMSSTHVVGLKNVTMNEAFFVGHFPDEPIMPGVLRIEAMAQAGGIFVLSQVEEPELYSTYFLKIDNVRFTAKVVPGDTLIFRCDLIEPIRRGICNMKVVAYVGNKVVTEAVLLAQIVKNPKQ